MKKFKLIALIILGVIVLVVGIVWNIKLMNDYVGRSNDIDENGDVIVKPIESINPDTGKITFKEDDLKVEESKDEKIIYKKGDETTNIVKSNESGALVEGGLKDSIFLEIKEQVSLGDFVGANISIENALAKYKFDESSQDLLDYISDISLVMNVDAMEIPLIEPLLENVKENELIAISIINARIDIQLSIVEDGNSLIVYSEKDILYIGQEEFTEAQLERLNEIYYDSTIEKYVFSVDGERIYALIYYDRNNKRRFAGFYFDSETPKVLFSTKLDW